MAVVAMVEPEIAENTVPATTATTASRPGTCRISRSTPSITLMARPVWNRTSPIRTNSGIGVSEKFITDTTLLRTTCARPGLAAEEQPRADDVDGDERQRHRHADQQQHRRAAEQQQRGQLPGHGPGASRRACAREAAPSALMTPTPHRCAAPASPCASRCMRNTNSIDSSDERDRQRHQQPPLRRSPAS